MTPDSLSQYSQAMGMTGYSNHHPFVHTLLIRLFVSLGNAVFHNVYAGIACYTVFQMIAMAVIVVSCISVLIRRRAGKKLCFCFLLFYALVPYNGIFAVTMWKDILFSGVLLLFVLCIYRFLPIYREGRPLYQKPLLYLSFLLWGILACLMRSNGLYVVAATAPFLIYAFRKQWKLILPSLLVILGCAVLIKGPVMDSLGVAKPAFSESLSIPAQQIARVVAEGRALTEDQISLIGKTMDYPSIPDYYQPELSDPVKALIQYGHPEYLETHKGEYLKLWVQLGLKYPLDYWNAFVDQTKGYWFPGAPGMLTNEGISPNELGAFLAAGSSWTGSCQDCGNHFQALYYFSSLWAALQHRRFYLGGCFSLYQLSAEWEKGKLDIVHSLFCRSADPLYGNSGGLRRQISLFPDFRHAAVNPCGA